jgi:hypothetical protein
MATRVLSDVNLTWTKISCGHILARSGTYEGLGLSGFIQLKINSVIVHFIPQFKKFANHNYRQSYIIKQDISPIITYNKAGYFPNNYRFPEYNFNANNLKKKKKKLYKMSILANLIISKFSFSEINICPENFYFDNFCKKKKFKIRPI